MPRTESEILFAWAHLADTQFRGADWPPGSTRWCSGRLRDDLAAPRRAAGPSTGAILVTGDVAYGGAEPEYAEASGWLAGVAEDAGVAKDRVHVVPGSDVDWKVDGPKDAPPRRLPRAKGKDPLDDALMHERADNWSSALAHYLAFASRLAPGCGGLFWARTIDARAGSACASSASTPRCSRPRGRTIGASSASATPQLEAELGGLGDGELVVVLPHHPFQEGWLADQTDADAWVRNQAHVHLFAHVTDHDSEQARSGADGAFVRVSAGITYAGGPGHDGPSYSVSAVVRAPDGSLTLRVWPRRLGCPDRDEALPHGRRAPARRTAPTRSTACGWRSRARASPPHPPRTPGPRRPPLQGLAHARDRAALVHHHGGGRHASPGRPRHRDRPARGAARLPRSHPRLHPAARPSIDLDAYLFTRAGYRCAVILVGEMGETQATLSTERLISAFDPPVIVSIGIAGGVHGDLSVGDVHVPSQATQYLQDSRAMPAADSRFAVVPGAPAYRADPTLLRAVRTFEFNHPEQHRTWVADGRADFERLLPDASQREGLVTGKVVHGKAKLLADGHVATGPVVGAAPAFSAWIRSHDRNVKSLEMESAAVLLAAQTRTQPKRALAIRGISDKGDADKSKLDQLEDGVLRRYAMRNAVRLLWALLDARALPQRPSR